jgi:hypothetical protein
MITDKRSHASFAGTRLRQGSLPASKILPPVPAPPMEDPPVDRPPNPNPPPGRPPVATTRPPAPTRRPPEPHWGPLQKFPPEPPVPQFARPPVTLSLPSASVPEDAPRPPFVLPRCVFPPQPPSTIAPIATDSAITLCRRPKTIIRFPSARQRPQSNRCHAEPEASAVAGVGQLAFGATVVASSVRQAMDVGHAVVDADLPRAARSCPPVPVSSSSVVPWRRACSTDSQS